MLALNVINKNALELLKPLDYRQVAPILFLQIEKIFSTILPNTEYGLRLFPLLCFWGAIFFFYKISKKLLHNPCSIIFALSLFVFNSTLIYFSSEVKQYMTDVFVLLAVFYFVLKDYYTDKNKYYTLGIVGGIAIFLSNVAPIILATCGLYLLYEQFFVKKNKKIMPLLAVFAVWLSLFALYYAFFIYNHPKRESMIKYWSNLNAFLPRDTFSNLIAFLTQKMPIVINMLSTKISKFFLTGFILIGFIAIIKDKKIRVIILTCVPFVLHLFLSTFQLYPFDTRLILYTLPCFVIICSLGFEFVLKMLLHIFKIKRLHLFAAIIPILFLLSGHNFKTERQEIKKSINYIYANISDNEAIYVYYGASWAFEYYNDIGFVKSKVPFINTTVEWGDFEGTITELKTLNGKNWLLFSHSYGEEVEITSKLDSIGYTKLVEFQTVGSSAYLYDFGE
jgi:hypothetical protein